MCDFCKHRIKQEAELLSRLTMMNSAKIMWSFVEIYSKLEENTDIWILCFSHKKFKAVGYNCPLAIHHYLLHFFKISMKLNNFAKFSRIYSVVLTVSKKYFQTNISFQSETAIIEIIFLTQTSLATTITYLTISFIFDI